MQVQATCQISAPKSKCFEAFSDLKNLSKWVTAIKEIELLTEGEIGKGTKFKETRVMFGSESSEVMEITLFEPSDHIREVASSNGLNYTSDWTFSEADGQTDVTVTFRIEAQTIAGKLMKLMFFFLKGSFKKAFLTDMEEMKKVIIGN